MTDMKKLLESMTILESDYCNNDVYHILPDFEGGYAVMHSWHSYGAMQYEYVETIKNLDELPDYLPRYWNEVKLRDSLHARLI